MDTIRINAPAKINLSLKVGPRRADGYHEIETLIQAISLCDRLEISASGADEDILEISGPAANELGQSPLEDNLVLRAVGVIRKFKSDIPKVRISLEKIIPAGAGLGGGSSDAAATLIGINRLFGIDLKKSELDSMGARLGSDVPFFVSAGSAQASGRGEIIENINLPTDYQILVVRPLGSVSTAQAYGSLKRRHKKALTVQPSQAKFGGFASLESMLEGLKMVGNDFEELFEPPQERPNDWLELGSEIRSIKRNLKELGSEIERLSGSGSAVYGIFPLSGSLEGTGKLRERGWQVFEAKPVSLPYLE